MADKLLDELKENYNQAKVIKQKMEADWYLNIAYYGGDQWIFWNRGRIDKPKLEDWRVTLVDNRILPIVSSRVSRKTKNKPIFVCTPFSLDDEDMNAAEISEKILENDWLKLNLSHKLFLAQMWSELTGSSFWKVYWDSKKGQKADYVVGQDGAPYRNEQNALVPGGQIEEVQTAQPDNTAYDVQAIARGDVSVDVLSPFEIFPDPLANSLEEAEWIIEEKVRSQEYVKSKFNYDATANADLSVGVAESRMFTFAPNTNSKRAKGVKVFEAYIKPCSKHPEGKWAVWVNDKLLKEENLSNSPYIGCPYVMFSCQNVPGRFWPTSVVSQLRGPQTELNKIQSQIRENAIRIGNAGMLLSRQANVEASGVPGEKIWYDDTLPNSMPVYLVPPNLPSYVLEQVDRIEKSIQEISGLHEVSNATVPSGVTAASAINLLQEADDTRLGPEIEDMERALSVAGDHIIKLRAKFNTDQRTIQLAGEDGDWDIMDFKNTMLKDNTNVDVQAGSAMPRSKAAKQAAMMEIFQAALQYGIDLDPRQIRRFFKDYEMGGIDKLFADISPDEQQIVRENRKLMMGTAIDINSWDDDEFHIAAHEEEQKTKRYENIDDIAKQVYELHVKAHRERRTEMINAQLAPPLPPENPAVNGKDTSIAPDRRAIVPIHLTSSESSDQIAPE